MGNCCLRRDEVTVARRMEEEREEGQALLRCMVLNSSEVDWTAVIAKANELHSKEQAWLRKHNRRERKMFARRQRRALQKRRRFDAIGSFSVNMLTYRLVSEDSIDSADEKKDKAVDKTNTSVCSSRDDHSYASSVTPLPLTRNHEECMERIDE